MRADEIATKERRAARETRRKALAEADRQAVEARQRAQLERARRLAAKADATPQIIEGGND